MFGIRYSYIVKLLSIQSLLARKLTTCSHIYEGDRPPLLKKFRFSSSQ